jgi:hypothetical protein
MGRYIMNKTEDRLTGIYYENVTKVDADSGDVSHTVSRPPLATSGAPFKVITLGLIPAVRIFLGERAD